MKTIKGHPLSDCDKIRSYDLRPKLNFNEQQQLNSQRKIKAVNESVVGTNF